MSTRTDLVAALAAGLDPDTYRVTGSPSCPDMIETGTFDVRAWANKLTPGIASGSVSPFITTPMSSPLTRSLTPGRAERVSSNRTIHCAAVPATGTGR